MTRKPTRPKTGKDDIGRVVSDASTDRFRRGIDGGMCARGKQQQRGKPVWWRVRANRESARTSSGRRRDGEARSTVDVG